jgi:hypothetical protein
MKRLILTITILLISSTAQAEADYLIKGAKSCVSYVEHYQKNDFENTINYAWTVGYLTGRNYADNGQRGKDRDYESIALWVYNYCQKNPLNDTAEAVEELAKELE